MVDISKVRIVNDFPIAGIKFYDITTVMNDAAEFQKVFNSLLEEAKKFNPEVIVALETRGYYFGPSLALALGVPFVPIRKEGKLPYDVFREDYTLEYGVATIEIHQDAIKPNQRVLIFDDILATGGTATAAIKLVQNFNPAAVSVMFFMEIAALGGRKRLNGVDVRSLATV